MNVTIPAPDPDVMAWLDRRCKNCSQAYGKHGAQDSACPIEGGYSNTSFFEESLDA